MTATVPLVPPLAWNVSTGGLVPMKGLPTCLRPKSSQQTFTRIDPSPQSEFMGFLWCARNSRDRNVVSYAKSHRAPTVRNPTRNLPPPMNMNSNTGPQMVLKRHRSTRVAKTAPNVAKLSNGLPWKWMRHKHSRNGRIVRWLKTDNESWKN